MKISSINAYGQRNIYQQRKAVQHPSITVPEAPKQSVSFQGKHSFAKGFAGIAGLLGTAGAVGGILIMTGGLWSSCFTVDTGIWSCQRWCRSRRWTPVR